eukprot:CAMPEP_0206134824 /NCGR_PEP_ID=MMETSP1473-20131121/225_1 /ASSEMBLY_ACC=CAM_ASM_001109 /TAXON_ID=1461547 /ORGANISM="Stichococcus sp, Strain RCC1054" /LENGTH=439 /DNA_ID=CAMNT_0053526447 /DNA_START=127 /DNA_END=1446 /DNA_ORIENTATION=+
MTRITALCAMTLAAALISSVQATRPGPMLRGGTLIIVSSRSGLNQLLQGVSEGRPSVRSGGFWDPAKDEAAFNRAEDELLGRAIESSSLFGRPSWFDQQPDMNFELFGPVPKYYVHHKGCGHSRAARAAQAANGDVLAKRMASERFGAEGLLAAMMAIAEVENQRAQNKLAMFGEQQGRSVRAEPQVKMTFDRALEAEFRGEGRAARAAERPFFGSADVLNAQWSGGDSKVAAKDPQAAPKWRARDFVARPAVHPVMELEVMQAQVPTLVGCEHLHAFPDLQHACRRGRGQALLGRGPRRDGPERPSMSWDLYNEDGQLNSGVLVFVLLSIACVAVWARLVAMWLCCALRGSPSPYGERRRCQRQRMRCELRRLRALLVGGPADPASSDGLSAPLLNPLAQEGLIARSYKVEEAASEAAKAPAVNYVTLQYQPLNSEAP